MGNTASTQHCSVQSELRGPPTTTRQKKAGRTIRNYSVYFNSVWVFSSCKWAISMNYGKGWPQTCGISRYWPWKLCGDLFVFTKYWKVYTALSKLVWRKIILWLDFWNITSVLSGQYFNWTAREKPQPWKCSWLVLTVFCSQSILSFIVMGSWYFSTDVSYQSSDYIYIIYFVVWRTMVLNKLSFFHSWNS